MIALALALAASAASPSLTRLAARVDAILDRPAFASAYWGVEVRSLRTGRVLYARDAAKEMTPASTLKLLATAAALDAYGPDARLRTTVRSSAALDPSGALQGDLQLVGAGDPNLSGRFAQGRITAALEEMADQLRAAGVRRVAGRLVGNESLFSGERRGDDWTWDDLVWWYGAEVSALAFNDNCVDITVSPGPRAGDPAVVGRNPVSSYYTLVSTATTSAAGIESALVLEKPAGANLIRLSGTYPLGQASTELNVALEDPARYTATVFQELLAARGIVVDGGTATTSEPPPADARVLAAHDSPTMAEMIAAVNKPSQNLHAEMMLRLAGVKTSGAGTVDAGRLAVQALAHRSGFDPQRWAIRDGSGLSRSDLIAPHELVDLLAAMSRHRYAAAFRDSLPVAGVDGSLRNRMKGTSAEGRVLAKTGSFRSVNAMAGYATTADGEPLAFAIMANHHTVDEGEAIAAIDAVAVLLAEARVR